MTSAAPAFSSAQNKNDALKARLGIAQYDRQTDAEFVQESLEMLAADQIRFVDTALVTLSLPAAMNVVLHFKDESGNPTGSLKHRLARALFIDGIVNGTIRSRKAIVEASSGSTAISEAYFARMLGLPFHAVMPVTTSPAKIDAIRSQGGNCHLVEALAVDATAKLLAEQYEGLYLDQFTNAKRVLDWRTENIASALLAQMKSEAHPSPDWIVVGAGTGGTAATFGRHLRYHRRPTRLCVADVEYSAFFKGYCQIDIDEACERPSRIEGVGRPRIEPSFMPAIIDRMVSVPDAVSIAGMRILNELLGRRVGPSTGLNFIAAAVIALEMDDENRKGSIATLICDCGDRYTGTYYNDDWLARQGLGTAVPEAERSLRRALLNPRPHSSHKDIRENLY